MADPARSGARTPKEAYVYIVLLGAPGSGKGTQAKIVSERLGLLHLSTGDMFRAAERDGTPLGLQAKAYKDRGQLVPDSITVSMVREALLRRGLEHGVILDGFPRTLDQARVLDRFLADDGRAIDRALFLNVPDAELVERLQQRWQCSNCGAVYGPGNMASRPGTCDRCGGQLSQRSDDRQDVVRERLEVYYRDTLPVVDYYRDREVLVEVNGNRPVSVVAREICDALEDMLGAVA
jgi:adenylate kinase